MIRVLLYIVIILVANIITGIFDPINFGMFIVPCGTFLIGVSFVLRDLVQNKYGRIKTYYFIVVALILSALFSVISGDILIITIASALAFIISETTDTEIYTRLKLPMHVRVIYSGIVGGTLDSTVFIVVGLSPLFTNIIPWEFVIYAITGQIIVKIIMQLIGAGVIYINNDNKYFGV